VKITWYPEAIDWATKITLVAAQSPGSHQLDSLAIHLAEQILSRAAHPVWLVHASVAHADVGTIIISDGTVFTSRSTMVMAMAMETATGRALLGVLVGRIGTGWSGEKENERVRENEVGWRDMKRKRDRDHGRRRDEKRWRS
jgi:hypothetical protein